MFKLELEFPIEYKNYKINRNSKPINKRSPFSGHEWTEFKPLSTLSISGKYAIGDDNFKSVEKAKEHIDFLIKIYANYTGLHKRFNKLYI